MVVSHILLANMLSPKRLVCSNNFHMAHPVPSYPYVLVNRSLLCNCHLESDLTYVLKSLGSCSVKNKFTMYFSLNSAFNHYMHKFGLPSQNDSFTSLFTYEPVFDIFLNKRLSFRPQINDSIPLLSLNPPDTLLELFQSFPNIPPVHPNSPFFPLVRHTSGCKSYKRLISNFYHSPCGVPDHKLCCSVYSSSPNISLFQTQETKNFGYSNDSPEATDRYRVP